MSSALRPSKLPWATATASSMALRMSGLCKTEICCPGMAQTGPHTRSTQGSPPAKILRLNPQRPVPVGMFTPLLDLCQLLDGGGQHLVVGCIPCSDGTRKVFCHQLGHQTESGFFQQQIDHPGILLFYVQIPGYLDRKSQFADIVVDAPRLVTFPSRKFVDTCNFRVIEITLSALSLSILPLRNRLRVPTVIPVRFASCCCVMDFSFSRSVIRSRSVPDR